PVASTEPRHLTPVTLSAVLKGARFGAHDFLQDAQARGAAAAVVRRGTPRPARGGLPFFEVHDTLAALGLLARARRRALPAGPPVVAITGSNGKTSAKEMIRATLSARWRVHATTGNLNNLIGVPLTILDTPADAEALVVEAGASVPGEIAKLRAIIEPSIAVITNASFAHVEGFGSLAGVMREQLALVDGVPVAVVGTEPAELAAEARRRTRTVVAGRAPAADVRPEAADLDDAGRPVVRWRGRTFTLPVVGLHQVENAMIALAVAEQAGVEPAAAAARLTHVTLPAGRGARAGGAAPRKRGRAAQGVARRGDGTRAASLALGPGERRALSPADAAREAAHHLQSLQLHHVPGGRGDGHGAAPRLRDRPVDHCAAARPPGRTGDPRRRSREPSMQARHTDHGRPHRHPRHGGSDPPLGAPRHPVRRRCLRG